MNESLNQLKQIQVLCFMFFPLNGNILCYFTYLILILDKDTYKILFYKLFKALSLLEQMKQRH